MVSTEHWSFALSLPIPTTLALWLLLAGWFHKLHSLRQQEIGQGDQVFALMHHSERLLWIQEYAVDAAQGSGPEQGVNDLSPLADYCQTVS
jgi:hypothetical protein